MFCALRTFLMQKNFHGGDFLLSIILKSLVHSFFFFFLFEMKQTTLPPLVLIQDSAMLDTSARFIFLQTSEALLETV